jgi:D-glycero-D-manno-heptose 1,7-bisphosphate phosphatase
MRTALLLDRDGVINVDRGYVSEIAAFEWRDGVFDMLAKAQERGHLLVIVTNQSGIGRGYYTSDDFERLTGWMLEQLADRGIDIARVYHCPFHPEAVVERYRAAHPWRKPEPGMLLQAAQDLGLDLGRSIMIGDQWTDMQAGHAAGVGRLLLVGEPKASPPPGLDGVVRLPDVKAAASWLNAAAIDPP